ncbi:glutamate-5-semialdehyde dehydrogenase [Spirochaetota bacterium]
MGYIQDICIRAKKASYEMMNLSTEKKDAVLDAVAQGLIDNKSMIITENKKDLESAKKAGLTDAMTDRLALDDKRIREMARSVKEIKDLKDPLGEVTYSTVRPNGIAVRRVRVPIGVIGIIFESRPNVMIDTASLCLKSGNACVLRGGKEAKHSNIILGRIITDGLKKAGVTEDAVQVVEKTERGLVLELLKEKDHIDMIVPRGGEGLISFVTEHSLIPVVKHDKGVCNIYIESDADTDMALRITENAKIQRPGVCNAVENIIIHKDFPGMKKVLENLHKEGVEIVGDEAAQKAASFIGKAAQEDYTTEYLDLKVSVKTVASFGEAVDFIHANGSGHTEAIITSDNKKASDFQAMVDSAVVLVNASTRFSDGGCFGLGAEVGISTQKLHVRGPMGLSDLTCLKYVVDGNGQTREQ